MRLFYISLFYQVVISEEAYCQSSARIRCLPIHATHPTYCRLLDIIILVISEDLYKSKFYVM
jgi:hypothetical protein